MTKLTKADFENVYSEKIDTGLGVRIGDVVTLNDDDEIVEVVGNVYDNPELAPEVGELTNGNR